MAETRNLWGDGLAARRRAAKPLHDAQPPRPSDQAPMDRVGSPRRSAQLGRREAPCGSPLASASSLLLQVIGDPIVLAIDHDADFTLPSLSAHLAQCTVKLFQGRHRDRFFGGVGKHDHRFLFQQGSAALIVAPYTAATRIGQ